MERQPAFDAIHVYTYTCMDVRSHGDSRSIKRNKLMILYMDIHTHAWIYVVTETVAASKETSS
jgi:hypothetical protein